MSLGAYLDQELCLKKVDVLGKIESILPGIAHHVGVEDFVGGPEHLGQVELIGRALYRVPQQPNQDVDDLSTPRVHVSLQRFIKLFVVGTFKHRTFRMDQLGMEHTVWEIMYVTYSLEYLGMEYLAFTYETFSYG